MPMSTEDPFNSKRRIALISTGGTIEKTYDELSGTLGNSLSVLDVMLAQLVLEGVELHRIALMNKDSLDMTDDDHALIAEQSHLSAKTNDGVIVVHGTDRLTRSGDAILAHKKPERPIVLTGAMRPYLLRNTDALQNLTEALLAVQLCGPGVYVAIHNRVLAFPGVVKDYDEMTFRYDAQNRRAGERRQGERRVLPRESQVPTPSETE